MENAITWLENVSQMLIYFENYMIYNLYIYLFRNYICWVCLAKLAGAEIGAYTKSWEL